LSAMIFLPLLLWVIGQGPFNGPSPQGRHLHRASYRQNNPLISPGAPHRLPPRAVPPQIHGPPDDLRNVESGHVSSFLRSLSHRRHGEAEGTTHSALSL
jgi:hypothetical protein